MTSENEIVHNGGMTHLSDEKWVEAFECSAVIHWVVEKPSHFHQLPIKRCASEIERLKRVLTQSGQEIYSGFGLGSKNGNRAPV